MTIRFLAMLACMVWSLAAQAQPVFDRLLPTSDFAPPGVPLVPDEEVSGTLHLFAGPARFFEVHTNAFDMDIEALRIAEVPPLTIDIVQDGTRVIPVRRGPIRGLHPHWEWIVQPGATWRDGDGRTWLSLPVALAERNANCVHNGLLKLEVFAEGARADLQIASETCAYFQFDMRAALDVAFTARVVDDSATIIEFDRRERAARLPERPIADLDYAARLGAKDQVPAGALSLRGVVQDGLHYVSRCPTRAGPYPFCSELVIPSYSWAKSIFAGVAAMRLERLHPGSMDRSIADYVGGCEEWGWGDVSVADALNMATGHYNDPRHELDEGSELMSRFFLSESHGQKIQIACRGFEKRAEPGSRFVYRTADSYIAGIAMTGILRSERGDAQADVQRHILQPMWDALDLSALMFSPRRTYDEDAMPFSGWGMYLTRADLARIAQFLHQDGAIDGESYLDSEMLSQALQRANPPHGLRAATDDQRYRYGFWAWDAGPFLGCDEDLWVPLMSGYGGLVAALLPGDRLYYHASDAGTHRWANSARAIHEYHPLCEVSP